MPEVHLTFLDGEVIAVDTELIDFAHPVIRARTVERSSNNEELVVPLSSVKYIVMGAAADGAPEGDSLGKVVIHFSDHEVLRAQTGRDTLGGPYGVIFNLIETKRKVPRRIGVPYTAVKAIFKVKDWEGRGATKPKQPRTGVAAKPARAKAPARKPVERRSASRTANR